MNTLMINKAYWLTTQNNPFDVEMYKALAEKYIEQHKLRAAEICLRKALWFAPRDTSLLDKLGRIYLEQNNIAKATQCFHEAMSYNTNHGGKT